MKRRRLQNTGEARRACFIASPVRRTDPIASGTPGSSGFGRTVRHAARRRTMPQIESVSTHLDDWEILLPRDYLAGGENMQNKRRGSSARSHSQKSVLNLTLH
jgi:hypothetical protein